MPRPKRVRMVGFEPAINYFKPAGVRLTELEETILSVDELEAVRLNDLEEKGQDSSAEQMGVSQPTFHRLLITARKKIADAIVNGKAIRVEGGNYKFIGPNFRGKGRRRERR